MTILDRLMPGVTFAFSIFAICSCGSEMGGLLKKKESHPAMVPQQDQSEDLKKKEEEEEKKRKEAEVTPVPSPIYECLEEKSKNSFVTSVIQDMYGRPPYNAELKLADDPNFNPETFVDGVLTSPAADDGLTRFISNLFRLSQIEPVNPNDTAEVTLISELKQEPVILVLRNKDKPWPYFFTTRDIYCTQNTAKLYEYPVFNTQGFVSCQMPPERAGFLGLVSVLRSTSPKNNPQAFYQQNNNYHRVAAAMYFAWGIQLLQATNGPAGDQKNIIPMAGCVPTTDMRVSAQGLIFGTAAIPLSGSTCSSCHSPFLGPISIAFRRFGKLGEILNLEDVDKLATADRNGHTPDQLKGILAEQNSCWSNDGMSPSQPFIGEPGFSELIAKSSKLGSALGIQIPQLVANISPDSNMSTSIEKQYNEHGQTLQGAFRGFFLSESYRCAKKP